MTERLYYMDSHMSDFSAHVVSCAQRGSRFDVILNRTAFFPEGGGQAADTGKIGGAHVLDVRERDGDIVHIADAAVETGSRVRCSLDWDRRFRRMQEHSGEHIISGTAHRLFGCENVGFHMGESGGVTIDFSCELTDAQLETLETVANMTVYRDLPVKAYFPSADELAGLEYRSKKELGGDVRIVSIEGVDCCACCAPHVVHTGEIGVIKLLSAERHRGGMRVTAVSGMDALEDYRARFSNVREISEALSAPQLETAAAVRRVLSSLEEQKRRAVDAQRETLKYRISALEPAEGNICLFESDMDAVSQRELVNAGMEKSRLCGVFAGSDGDWKYIIGSLYTDLRAAAKEINDAIAGRGGGSTTMIQGTSNACKADIKAYFASYAK